MIQIIVFIPESHAEAVKQAMFQAGGGKIGNYEHCCFEIRGVGQFRPLKGSNAFIGEVGVLETVPEIKVEMTCEDTVFEQVVQAMKAAHPYETPAYYGIKTVSH